MKKSELKEAIKNKIKSVLSEDITNKELKEGTWSSGTYNEIGRFIQDVKNLKDKYYNIVGNDDVFDGLDRAEESAREMMIDAPENRSDLNEDKPEDDMHDDPGDIRIDHDYYTENLKEESRFPIQADIDDIENSGNIDIAYDKAMKLLKSLMNKSVSFADIREDEDEDDKKAYKGAAKIGEKKSKRDKAIDAYNEIGGSEEVKAKAKKAKEGDKEALSWLKSNQKVIKAYNDIPK
jgi:hypothetical protein